MESETRISTERTDGQLGPDEIGEVFIEKVEEDGGKIRAIRRLWREGCSCQTEE